VVVAELVPAVQADHEADRSDLPLRARHPLTRIPAPCNSQ
jgi:hypothetical protein